VNRERAGAEAGFALCFALGAFTIHARDPVDTRSDIFTLAVRVGVCSAPPECVHSETACPDVTHGRSSDGNPNSAFGPVRQNEIVLKVPTYEGSLHIPHVSDR
jgi:hypothetical protein